MVIVTQRWGSFSGEREKGELQAEVLPVQPRRGWFKGERRVEEMLQVGRQRQGEGGLEVCVHLLCYVTSYHSFISFRQPPLIASEFLRITRRQNPNLSVNSEQIHHLVIDTFNQTHEIIVQKWNENYQNTPEDSASSSSSMKICRKSNWDQNAQLLIHDEKISWNKKILESACPSHSLSESRNTQEAQHTLTRMSYKC